MSNAVAVDNPLFARVWKLMSSHETAALRRLRAENLSGLTGRVLEVGAGTGTNFEFYPDTVREVVAIEPEHRLAEVARQAAITARMPITVSDGTIEAFDSAEPFDAIVCSLVLCSIDDPETVLRQLFSVLTPGGQLRYMEHVASSDYREPLQRLADATLWPRLFGNCHTHRHTEEAISGSGFAVETARRVSTLPVWVPLPVAEFAIGRAVRPA